LFDDTGSGFNVEAMVGYRAVAKLANRPLIHTNHALDAQSQAVEANRPADLLASSVDRLARAEHLLDEIAGRKEIELADLIALTRDPEAICRRSEAPHHTESSGAVIMQPRSGLLWACWGLPAENDFEEFKV
jgi:hypothetical protein